MSEPTVNKVQIQYNEARCTTTSTVLEAELKWSIHNFGFKCHSKKPGTALKSMEFHAPGDSKGKWYVQVYPNGVTRNPGIIYLSLCPLVKVQSELFVSISITLWDEVSMKQLYSETYHKNFTSSDAEYSIGNVRQENYRSVENLLVCCKLKYEMNEQLKTLDLPYDSTPLAANVTADLTKFFASMTLCDVTFVVDKKEFQAHKAILAARSPVFAAMFQHDMKEAALNRVNIVDVEPDIFQTVLRFIYTDQVGLTGENSPALLVAANRYNLDLLKWKCEVFLSQHLCTEICCGVLDLADIHGAVNLKKAVINFIRNFSSKVVSTDEWKKMKKSRPDLVCDVVQDLLS